MFDWLRFIDEHGIWVGICIAYGLLVGEWAVKSIASFFTERRHEASKSRRWRNDTRFGHKA
jgi:hypothetical protein